MTDPTSPATTSILRRIAEVQTEPPAGLWSRIETTHAKRTARRRRRRLAGGSVLAAALIGIVSFSSLHSPSSMPGHGADVDWQARAQALELQLQTMEHGRDAPAVALAANDTDPATVELEDIDHRLQAAYERGVYTNELVPLWKRRSELLDTLITARKQGLKLTRI